MAYEIVRCRRTMSDRTVVTQGLLSKTFNFRGWKGPGSFDSTVSLGDIDRRPYVMPTYADVPKFCEDMVTELKYHEDPVDTSGLFTIISSDIAFNKTQDLIKPGMYIVPLYVAYSRFGSNNYTSNSSYLNINCAVAPNLTSNGKTVLRGYGELFDGDGVVIGEGNRSDSVIFNFDYTAGLVKPYIFTDKQKATNNNTSSRSARII